MPIRLEFCALDAVDELMGFLRDHWSETHVLARRRDVLDWQHRDEAAGRYNFLLARDDADAIVGMLGFIPSSRYDPALAAGDETVWLTTWKVVEGRAAGLGLMLLRELPRRLRPRWIGTVGLNAATRGIYDALGYRTGVLDRHYRLRPHLSEPVLAIVPFDWPSAPPASTHGTFEPIADQQFLADTDGLELDGSGQTPRKSRGQFVGRYLDHPFYDYRLYLARTEGDAAVVATRICEHEGARALRIVDLLGSTDALAGCGEAIDRLLVDLDCEYVDFYAATGREALAKAGFRMLNSAGPLVLPSYFEPFDRKNVDVRWSLLGAGDPLVIGKGDCDQDRPNLLVVAQ